MTDTTMQIWNQQRGKTQFFAWKPIPPNPAFVAMGMVGTTTEDEPPRDIMRCVPKHWLTETTFRCVHASSSSAVGCS